MSEDDFNFWTDLGKAPNDMIKGFIEGTRKQLLPIRERIEFFKDGQDFIHRHPGDLSARPYCRPHRFSWSPRRASSSAILAISRIIT